MHKLQRQTTKVVWAFGLLMGVFGLWLLFSLTPPGHYTVQYVRAVLPRWYVAMNLVLVPVLLGLSAAPRRISFRVRIILSALAVSSLVMAQIAASVFVAAYCAMLAVLLLEAYWLIPKWKARHRRAL